MRRSGSSAAAIADDDARAQAGEAVGLRERPADEDVRQRRDLRVTNERYVPAKSA